MDDMDRKAYKILEFKTIAAAESAINLWTNQAYSLKDFIPIEIASGKTMETILVRYIIILVKRF